MKEIALKCIIIGISSILFFTQCSNHKTGNTSEKTKVNLSKQKIADTTEFIGFLQGKAIVGSIGSSLYTIPIDVPPGTGGMNPKLALTYSSQQKNSITGMGFNLSGFSSITRTGATLAQDQFTGGINFDENDRFAIDGQRLMLIQGSAYGADQSSYRTEIESFKNITAIGNCGSGPCSFIVKLKDGTQLQYGGTMDSQALALGKRFTSDSLQGSIMSWLLNKITDRNGNYMTFAYTGTPCDTAGNIIPQTINKGYIYPQTIDYTSNAAGNLSAQRSIRFFYEPRPDTATQFIAGSHSQLAARLTSIRTNIISKTYDTIPVKAYDILYDTLSPMGTSRIISVLNSAGNSKFAPLQFSWSNGPSTFLQSNNNLQTGLTDNNGYTADFNGDGLSDLLSLTNSIEPVLFFSTGSGMTPNKNLNLKLNTYNFPGDFNGDGLADILTLSSTDGTLYLSNFSNGSNFAKPIHVKGFNITPAGVGPWIGDFNGDGKSDLLAQEGDVTKVYISKGNGFTPKKVQNLTLDQNFINVCADFNGDGLSDIFSANGTSGALFISNLSNGSGFKKAIPVNDLTLSNCSNCLWIGDFNGDGLPDILGNGTASTFLMYGNGHGFEPAININININNGQNSWLGDYNGDGLMDIYNASSDTIFFSNGSSFIKVSVPDNTLLAATAWGGDFNGDGATDMFGVTSNSFYYAADSTSFNSKINQAPNLLVQISNGLGETNTLTYKPITDSTIYSKNNYSALETELLGVLSQRTSAPLASVQTPLYPKLRKARSGMYVVASSTMAYSDDFIDSLDTNNKTYYYKDGLIDLQGRGFLGFNSIIVNNEATGKTTTSFYNQVFPLTGTVSSVQSSCNQSSTDPNCQPGSLLATKNTTYIDTSFIKGVYQVQLQNTRNDFYDYGNYGFSIGNKYQYDAFGNPILKSYLGYVNLQNNDLGENDNVYTMNTYSNDTTAWQLSFLTSTKVSSTADISSSYAKPAKSKSKKTFKDQVDFSYKTISYSSDGKMNVNAVSIWDNTNSCFTTTLYQYDNFGNKTAVTQPNGATFLTSYDNFYHTFPDIKTTPSNQQGQKLQSFLGYDPRYGKQVARTDYNGNVFINTLDSFGQYSGKQGPIPDSITFSGSVNNVSFLVSGSYNFPQAKVIDLINQQWSVKNNKLYADIYKLQQWPSDTSLTMSWQRTFLNSKGRICRVVRSGACINTFDIISDIQYKNNKVISQSYPYVKGTIPVYATNTYDAYGRVLKNKLPAGPKGTDSTVTLMSYKITNKGIIKNQTLAQGKSYAYTNALEYHIFNSKSKPVKFEVFPSDQTIAMSQESENVTSALSSKAVTSFHYDRLGRNTAVVDPKTKSDRSKYAVTTTYDSQGRKIKSFNPSQGTKQYIFNPQGKLQTLVSVNGKTNYMYDSLGRVTSKTYPDSTSVIYTYDGTNIKNGNGKLSNVTKTGSGKLNSSIYTYDYDNYGNLESSSLSIIGKTFNTIKKTDPTGRVYQYTYPDGKVLYQHYNLCNLDSVSLDGETIAIYSNYNSVGLPELVTYGNDVETEFDYSPFGQLSTHRIISGDETLLYDSLVWNNLNQLEMLVDKDEDSTDYTQTFTYNNLRLKEASGNEIFEPKGYDYDDAGNLTAMDDLKYLYSGQQIIGGIRGKDTVFTATYSKSGNLLTKKMKNIFWTYKYDSENKLTHVYSSDKKVKENYGYDYLGNRVIKTGNHGNTRIYVDDYYEINIRKDSSFSETNYVLSNFGRIASVTTDHGIKGSDSVKIIYFHKDHLQSTVLTTNEKGDKTSKLIYEPYGEYKAEDDSLHIRFTYTDKEFDTETKLYNFKARYYDPMLGRFITADNGLGGSYRRQDSYNRYAYAFNSPLSYWDPNGKAAITGATMAKCAITAVVASGSLLMLTDKGISTKGYIGRGLGLASMGGCIVDILKDKNINLWETLKGTFNRQNNPAGDRADGNVENPNPNNDPDPQNSGGQEGGDGTGTGDNTSVSQSEPDNSNSFQDGNNPGEISGENGETSASQPSDGIITSNNSASNTSTASSIDPETPLPYEQAPEDFEIYYEVLEDLYLLFL